MDQIHEPGGFNAQDPRWVGAVDGAEIENRATIGPYAVPGGAVDGSVRLLRRPLGPKLGQTLRLVSVVDTSLCY